MSENSPKPHWLQQLERGETATLVVFGTSLSLHLAPHLRHALSQRFGASISVVNAGMAAKASRTALAELDGRVLRAAPDAVLLEWAVNDAYSYEEFRDETLDKGISLAESRANLEMLIERIEQAQPDCEIVLQTMNPTFDAPGGALAGSRRPQLERFYEGYRAVASAHGLRLLDNHAMWLALQRRDLRQFERLIPDGAHPTPAAIREVLLPHLLAQLLLESDGAPP
ncbi:MAG TPA: SGNH/GDSL hydrolase family protein [Abditibacterium sp.]|jgi:lysophospholipase L1-like esterase